MKKIILILLLLTFKLSLAQTGWFWQNPKPQGMNINEVKFINANTAIAVIRGCSIMKSTDKGLTWSVKNVIPAEAKYLVDMNSINVLNSGVIYILYSAYDYKTSSEKRINKILKSTDEGETWSITDVPDMNYFNSFSLKFINNNTGFLCSTYDQTPEIYKTTNSGGSWTRFSINGNDSLTNFFFLNENTGWIGSKRDKNYYKTTNAGLSWSTATLAIPTMPEFEHWTHSFFLNENTGWISGLYPGSYKTTNGGTNWIAKGFSFYNGKIFFLNEFTGYAYGSSVYKTTNGGENWQSLFSEQDYAGFSLSANNLDGIAVGKYGKILTTSNGGTNWVNKRESCFPALFTYPDNIEDIFFLDNNTGWCVGWSNGAYKTTNSGANWTRFLTGNYPDKIKFLNASTGISAGVGGITRTTNGGLNWTAIAFNESYNDFPYFKNDTAYMQFYPFEGALLMRSTNAGANWITHSTRPEVNAQSKLHFVNSKLVFSTYYAGLQRSYDGGITWEFLHQFFDTPVYNLYFINENTGFVSLDSGLYKTTNAGQTFTKKKTLWQYMSLKKFQFINDNTGWAAGGGNGLGVLLKTTNKGETWLQESSVDYSELNALHFINENTGWVCGNNETILKTTTGGTIGIQQISTSLPDKFYLSQNYPNPFNPNTNIEFSLPQKSFVKLKVFDLLGREIANLVNENLSAGSYKYDFNASALPSGIYFYKLETENFSETRKMVLIK